MKRKRIIIFTIGGILILSVFLINYLKNKNPVLKTENTGSGMFSYMIETEVGSGNYEMAEDNKWPGSGYIYNEQLSKCENGSILTWNDETKSVTVKSNVSDKCYLYFDIEPPDILVTTNNTDNTFNPSTPATLNCLTSEAYYNQKYQRIEISSVSNKYNSCSLTYQTPSTKNYLNTYITSLAGQTQGDGQVVNENGYRYEGKNPNNYIWFNNELWRIIGVFDSNSHGQSGQNLVKIIRANSLGGLVWDKSNTNDWTASSLMNLLNGAYLNSEDGTDSGYCYGYSVFSSNEIVANCDYTAIGIKKTARNMIASVTWYLGGYADINATADAFYEYERGDTVYSGRPTATTDKKKIGLMYPSDYGYSVLASSCARTTNLGDYGSSTCAGESWLYGQGEEWLLNPCSSDYWYVFRLSTSGKLGRMIYSGAAIRPVLYLNSNAYVVGGSGTQSNPYIIGI